MPPRLMLIPPNVYIYQHLRMISGFFALPLGLGCAIAVDLSGYIWAEVRLF
jgi:hypothetical protein